MNKTIYNIADLHTVLPKRHNMEEINKAIQELSEEQLTKFKKIMDTLDEDMKDVKMESIRMAHEAEVAAASAFLNC